MGKFSSVTGTSIGGVDIVADIVMEVTLDLEPGLNIDISEGPSCLIDSLHRLLPYTSKPEVVSGTRQGLVHGS